MGTYLDKREAVDFRQGHEHGFAVHEAAADLIPAKKWIIHTDRVRNR